MKVCYKAGAVTAQNHYYSIAADAVEIRVWFLTDDIIRIRAGFDGDWDEASYSLVTTAWESRTDELMKDYRKRINVAEAALVDGETRAVITGKKLRVEVEKDPFRICVYDAEGTMLHADIPELAYREDSNRRRIHTSQIEDDDYFYGYMADHTGYVKYFDLKLYDEGFVLELPERKAPSVIPPFAPEEKIFQVQKESQEWAEKMDISYVGDLNDRITSEGVRNILLVQEALQEAKISRIAQQIVEDGSKKFIMIAGPSSSGKTSFSHRLSIQLTAHGMKPHPIAVDNYFKNREDTPLDEYGERNYECLEALDVEKFNEDMLALLRGERIELPVFNFVTGHREYRGDFLKLGKEDVLVIEGIHGLNDKLSHSLPKESKFKIYISALTQLNIDKHNRIPTTDGRLIRRIVRDARTRGTSAKDTIARWPSVRRGEEANIFPYQEEADVMFNSALVYELACLKLYAEPRLFGIGKDEPEYIEAKRLLKFFDYFVAVPSDDIPRNSLLREFVGGSCFDV